MTYVRLGFLGAFLLLIVGGYTARSVVAPYFSQAGELPSPSASTSPTPHVEARRLAAPTATAVIVTATPTSTPLPTPTPRVIVVTPVPSLPAPHHAAPPARRVTPPAHHVTPPAHHVTPPAHHRAPPAHHVTPPSRQRSIRLKPRPTPSVAPTSTPVPTATPSPTAIPTTGVVALSNYWVNQQSARPGQVIAIGYVIRNDTGRTEKIELGASLKARSVPSWTAAINDPYHDVVAVVPPGATVHVRYFTLPAGLRPGTYDVAWGLRDAITGRRLGLAFAPSVVTVTR